MLGCSVVKVEDIMKEILKTHNEAFSCIISLNLHVLKEGGELKDFLGSKFRKVKLD